MRKVRVLRLLGCAACAAGAVYAVVTFTAQSDRMAGLKQTNHEMQQTILEKKQEVQELEYKISYADSNEFIEQTAREKLGYVKPGDIKYIIDEN